MSSSEREQREEAEAAFFRFGFGAGSQHFGNLAQMQSHPSEPSCLKMQISDELDTFDTAKSEQAVHMTATLNLSHEAIICTGVVCM